jgi:hypothetical protein
MLGCFGWIEVIALVVIALVLFACFWGSITRWELLTRAGARTHAHRLAFGRDHFPPSGPTALPEGGSTAGYARGFRLEPETARWLWNEITFLIRRGRLSTPAAAFLRGREEDDAVLAQIYRTHALEPKQFYVSEEESIIAACEYVARLYGCRPAPAEPPAPGARSDVGLYRSHPIAG